MTTSQLSVHPGSSSYTVKCAVHQTDNHSLYQMTRSITPHTEYMTAPISPDQDKDINTVYFLQRRNPSTLTVQ